METAVGSAIKFCGIRPFDYGGKQHPPPLWVLVDRYRGNV
jgi:hypothetical protein